MKELTNEAITRLFYSLTGRPVPSDGLTEAQREAREKHQLQEQCLWEVAEAREQEKLDRLAEVLGLSATIELPEADLITLHKALVG